MLDDDLSDTPANKTSSINRRINSHAHRESALLLVCIFLRVLCVLRVEALLRVLRPFASKLYFAPFAAKLPEEASSAKRNHHFFVAVQAVVFGPAVAVPSILLPTTLPE